MGLAAEQSRELRIWYKAHGICVQCGAGFAKPGITRCPDCRKKHKLYQKRYDPDGSKHKAMVKALREDRKAKGLCIECGKPNDGVHIRCAYHMQKASEARLIFRIKDKMRRQNDV